MAAEGSLGARFGWMWTAYAVSTGGTWFPFEALPMVAILVLGAGSAEASALKAVALLAAAAVATPLGAWVEGRNKRRVMIGLDFVRFAAFASLPLAYALGQLSFPHLLAVSAISACADVLFKAASGAYLKMIVPPARLLEANARFEATLWSAAALGPPIGGVAISVLGPFVTIAMDAFSYLASAAALTAAGGGEASLARAALGPRAADYLAGWRFILSDTVLRPLFFNSILVNALILAVGPSIAVLMLGRLGFSPWQYGLAFGAPCAAGLLGARLSARLVARFGERMVLLGAGALRACWPIGLAFVGAGYSDLALVTAIQFGLIASIGVFNPVFAARRLECCPPSHVTRVLTAWSVASNVVVGLTIALWGLLGWAFGPRAAIAAAGLLLLATPITLFRADDVGAIKSRLARWRGVRAARFEPAAPAPPD